MNYKKTTLKNGLRIITVPQKGALAVTVLVLIGTGSKYETREISGISHFLEHMFFKGTKKRPTPMSVVEPLDRIGGIFNAFTGEEYTGYYAKVSARHFDLAMDWVSDICLNSLLPTKEVKKEKGVIIEEINMHYDIPMNYVQALWNRLLYGDQPAGWDIAGTKESVAAISRKQILDYMKSQYVASNTIICIAGNIKEPLVIKKAKKHFFKISDTEFKRKVKVIEKQKKPECLLHPRETEQSHFCLGTRAYNLFHPQKYTLDVLGVILGGMMSSRLFNEIREKLGIAYYVRTSVNADTDTGFLVTQAGVDNQNIKKAISAVLKEYRKISQRQVPLQELKKAKDCIKGRTSLVLESSDAQASFYGVQELLEGRILTPKEIYARINKVSQSDISRVAKDIFSPQKLNLAIIGPFKDKQKFQKLLKI